MFKYPDSAIFEGVGAHPRWVKTEKIALSGLLICFIPDNITFMKVRGACKQVLRDIAQEPRWLVPCFFSKQGACLRHAKCQQCFCARERHIAQPPLFFHIGWLMHAQAMREYALLKSY